ncbi:MAG: hypothetical protein E7430_09640 [Ruminococcaceae bacterium]|nr:hypothetical protein [Oscillospiraceae bacterium]
MKYKSKKAAAAALVFALLLCTFTASASVSEPLAKEEVVYASLSTDGSVSGVYVVNSFELDEDTVVTDHGQYSSVVNLTNGSEINHSGNTISVEAEKGMFWYQGNMDNAELPWNIAIEYWFDGEKTDSPAGKSGAMELKILTTKNENASGTFFEDYTLQISVTLDTALCSHIEAPAGTVAASGNDKIINFVGMAGSEGEFTVTADVVDFEMGSITIAGVRMDMGSYLESFDLSAVTEEFSSQFAQLSDGIAQLDDGAGQINAGMAAYAAGVGEYSDGVGQISDAVKQVNSGVGDLADGAAELSAGIGAASYGLNTLGSSGASIAEGAKAIMDSTFSAVNAELSEAAAAYGTEFSLTPENYSGILATFKKAMPTMSSQIDRVKAQLDGVVQFYNGVKAYTDGVSEVAGGIAQLSAGMSQYSAGVSELSKGTSELARGTDELASGAKQLADSAKQLSAGVSEYKVGTALMRSSTDGLDQTIADSISGITDELVSQPGEICSFTSEENTAVESVQFVMRTEAVAIESPASADEEVQPLTFWQKLLALFGL